MEPLDFCKDKSNIDILLQAANNSNRNTENNNLFVRGKQLCNFENKVITTIKRNYLPRDVVNEKHVIQVFKNYEYKRDLIEQEIKKMKTLKRSFKQSARNVIEKSYVEAANDLGWCRADKQKILNKGQMFGFIKSNNMEEMNLMRDLWDLQYERFRRYDGELIKSFVTKYMDDNNIVYEENLDGNRKTGSGCMEVIATAIKTDINKQIRGITKERYKWVVKERHENGGKNLREKDITPEERFRKSIHYFPDYITQSELYGRNDCPSVNKNENIDNVTKKIIELQNEIKFLQAQNKGLVSGISNDDENNNSMSTSDHQKENANTRSKTNVKKKQKTSVVSGVDKNTIVLKEIPHRILMQNVNVHIDNVTENGCVNIGSHVVGSDKPLGKNACQDNVKDVTNEKENILHDKKKQSDKSIDNSMEDEDNQRGKKGGKEDISECNSLSENEYFVRDKKPGKDDFFECDHEQWNELDNPQYCINRNELHGVFCHVCKKEFVHKYSDDPKKRKDQWKPGCGDKIVHACLHCHTCGMAYCHACYLKKICNSTARLKRKRRGSK